jgi:hypothetical protein
MIDTGSFWLHFTLFAVYMISCICWVVWNHASNQALDSTINAHLILNIDTEYENWMKSYYQCMLQFCWANCLVQVFTIWIFYNLTRKDSSEADDIRSTISSDEDNPLTNSEDHFDTGKEETKNEGEHLQTNDSKARTRSIDTIEEDSDEDKDSAYTDNRVMPEMPKERKNSDASDNSMQLRLKRVYAQSKLQHRIYAQFLREGEEAINDDQAYEPAPGSTYLNPPLNHSKEGNPDGSGDKL